MVNLNRQQLDAALEVLFYGYRNFTSQPDVILATRGLGRVHHRILYFVARAPGQSVNRLLAQLKVSKQALNAPLRQLLEMGLVQAVMSDQDRRVKCLSLTEAGTALESQLSESQYALLTKVFDECGPQAEAGWRKVMHTLAQADPKN